MRVMVACTTLTWIEVDMETEQVGPARVFNMPENVEIEGVGPNSLPGLKPTVIVTDTRFFDEESVTPEIAARAIELVGLADEYTFVMEED